ncbi:DNA mismatch endonuclease Vsr [Candidatus Microgenomates bacterium]|nr:DNA mismatch endonuclease Vsr [Candidatus Microgenomates bacterium]
MLANVGHETKAETQLRHALTDAGVSYLTACRPEPAIRCEADFVFPRQKLCVFIDGCFWHRCDTHFFLPKTNAAWWDEKIRATVNRDRRQTTLLEANGWRVIRVWEHEVAGDGIKNVVARIMAHLQ